jgi:hypothetical protein
MRINQAEKTREQKTRRFARRKGWRLEKSRIRPENQHGNNRGGWRVVNEDNNRCNWRRKI